MAISSTRREAYSQGKRLSDMLRVHEARCMEQVIDQEHDLFFERWLLPNGVGVVLMYSPSYGEIFIQGAPKTNSWEATETALKAASFL